MSLVGLRGVSAQRIEALLQQARAFRAQVHEGASRLSILDGKTVALMFMENSTRTRSSFEMACYRLGATPLSFSAAGSSTKKGETLHDTARVLESVGADALVIRDRGVGVPHQLDSLLGIPVVNAGDGTNEHPTQALLDLLTMTDRLGELRGRTVAIVGDVKHSRVARSNAHALRTLGVRVLMAGPGTLCPPEIEALGAERRSDIDAVLEERPDVLMMLRIQRERLGASLLASEGEYRAKWGLTRDRMERLVDHAVVMHPAPMNRGVEIDDAAADGPHSAVFPQMANGVFVRMSVLAESLGGVQ